MILRGRLRIIDLLAMIYDSREIMRIKKSLLSDQKDKRANAAEILDVMLSQDRQLHNRIMPVLTAQTTADLFIRAQKQAPAPDGTLEDQLVSLYEQDDLQLKNKWLAACVLYALPALSITAVDTILESASQHPEELLRQIAQATLQHQKKIDGEPPMMLAIEKVLILKTVRIFSETPDDILAELAPYLDESEVAAGQAIFEKGEPGNSMYIIVSGQVRVHDGEHTINILNDRDVFGEMALLDPAPRSASITTIKDTHLLSLGHDPFYEAVDTRSEIARGVIRVLSRRLRGMVKDS
jgi:hypothetical protein